MKPPYHAEHVGSLLRPAGLLQARTQFENGQLSAAELRQREDAAIRAAVSWQESVGLPVVTDGEFRRGSWLEDFAVQLYGVEGAAGKTEPDDDDVATPGRLELGEVASATSMIVNERIALPNTIFGEDFRYLAEVADTAHPKVTIPSPSMIHYRTGRAAIDTNVYPDLDQFWEDLSRAYAAQLKGLSKLGCTYVQLDDVTFAYLNDPRQRQHVQRIGGDPDTQHHKYIEVLNRALAQRPSSLTVAVHMCRGNLRSSWMAEGSYDFVAEALFGDLQVDGFFLEYDDDRSGGFEPLRFVRKGTKVVLGLVTTKTGALESRDALKRRIEEAAKFVDPDCLCLSPQCGFASMVQGNQLSFDEQVAKLELVCATAAEVWGVTV